MSPAVNDWLTVICGSLAIGLMCLGFWSLIRTLVMLAPDTDRPEERADR